MANLSNAAGDESGIISQAIAKASEYRTNVFRWVVGTLIVVALAAQFIQPLARLIDSQRFFGIGVILAVVLGIFESITSIEQRIQGPTASSGFTVEHYSDLRDFVAAAFESPDVSISFAAYSGETLYAVLSEFFALLQNRRMQLNSLDIRILLPDYSNPIPVPCGINDSKPVAEASEEARVRVDNYIDKFAVYIEEIREAQSVRDLKFSAKKHPLAPQLKVLILNHTTLFASVYPILETKKRYHGQEVAIFDFRGARSKFVGFELSGSQLEKSTFAMFSDWFEAVWTNVATVAYNKSDDKIIDSNDVGA